MVVTLERIRALLREFNEGKYRKQDYFQLLLPLLINHLEEMDESFLEYIEVDESPLEVFVERPGSIYFFIEEEGARSGEKH